MALLGTKDAADRLGVSVRRIQAMIKQGIVPAQKFGRDWAIDEADVEKLAKSERKTGRPPKKK
jgi:excisionase family DNA binding protein